MASTLYEVKESMEGGKHGILVQYPEIGFAYALAEQAAKQLGKELLEQQPLVIMRDDRKHYFFVFSP